ncbi:hypothetical protein Avbf_10927 [Armadillidium vulgare]|nr:hypothetical protein Avbf_10927 [Armadillidium vulgare]
MIYDARKNDFSSGQRWQDEAILSGRAFFTFARTPPALVIDPTEADDQGIFTCRIEYIMSPSSFVKVNLSVIVPPDPPSIILEKTKR